MVVSLQVNLDPGVIEFQCGCLDHAFPDIVEPGRQKINDEPSLAQGQIAFQRFLLWSYVPGDLKEDGQTELLDLVTTVFLVPDNGFDERVEFNQDGRHKHP